MAITDVLHSSKLGLFANQAALKVTSHNIANVNTPGFSRQSINFESQPGAAHGQSAIGAGVDATDVSRVVDDLVDRRLRLSMAESGRLEARDRFLTLVEDVFNEMDGDGFSQRLEEFFDAVDVTADNPTNPVARAQAVSDAESLALFASRMHDSLSELALPVDDEITGMLDEINTMLVSIQELDSEITLHAAAGTAAPDLEDQRQTLIMELSELMDVQAYDNANGSVSLLTGSGQLLMEGSYVASFSRSAQLSTASGYQGIVLNASNYDYTDQLNGGALKGLIEIRDEVINGASGYLTRLESLVDEVRFQANVIQAQSAPQDMNVSQTGVQDLGTDLTTVIGSLITDEDDADYLGSPTDLSRVVAGTITLVSGADADNLTSTTAAIDPATQSITDIANALTATGVVTASVNANNQLVLASTNGTDVYAVASDTSNILAALGVGALFGGNGARDMSVNAEIVADPDLLPVSQVDMTGTTPAFNDAGNLGMLALGELRAIKFDIGGDLNTFTGHYADITGDLGVERNQNRETMAAQESAREFMQEVRDSISSVSLEEELTDLVKFQRAFQASSKMVTVADELLQSIISMV